MFMFQRVTKKKTSIQQMERTKKKKTRKNKQTSRWVNLQRKLHEYNSSEEFFLSWYYHKKKRKWMDGNDGNDGMIPDHDHGPVYVCMYICIYANVYVCMALKTFKINQSKD